MAIRVVVAGLGARGMDWVRALQASGVATIAGACDPHEEARRRAVGMVPGLPAEAGLAAIVRATGAEAVVVAAPPQTHAPLVEEAVGLGLATLVEKPFALDLASAARLARLAEARGLPLLVAQNYRYMRAHRTVRRLVAEDVLGDLREVAAHYWRASHPALPWLAALEAPALWESGAHHLDALRYCLGRPVVGLSADVSGAAHAGGMRGSSARVVLEFEGGIRGVYTVSWDAPGHEFFEAGQQFYERLTGARGTLHVLQRWLLLCLTGGWPRPVGRGRRVETEEAVLLRQLAAARHGQADVECSARDNLQTMAVLEACQVSWRTRRWVDPQALLRDALAD